MADSSGLTSDQQSAQDYINNSSSGFGGIDKYTQTQQQRYSDALASGDTNTINHLNADAQRTGLSYAPNDKPASTSGTSTGTTGTTTGNNPSLASQLSGAPSNVPSNAGANPAGSVNWASQMFNAASNPTPASTALGVTSPAVPPSTPPSDGTLHLNVNGQAQPDIPVYKGSSFESGADLAKQLGLDYKADPKTGEVTIGGQKIAPISYDKNGDAIVGVRSVANALGYQIGYDDKSKQITITGKAPTKAVDTGSGSGQPTGNGYSSPIQSIYQGMPQMQPMTPWQQPDVSGFQQNMMPYQSFNPDPNSFYQQAHAQLDPQFDANNQKLMDKQNLDIQKSDESMNRRGIYSSGVAQAAEDDLRAKTTNALAAGFTAQMGQIEKTAQTLYNTAYKQYQDGNQFALKNNQDQINNMLNVEKQSFSEWAQTQKLDQSQYNYALKAWNDMASKIMTDAENQTKANQFQQTQSFDQYKFNNPSAAQQLPYQYQTANNAANNATSTANNAANNQTKEDIATLPYKQMTVYQQATTSEKAQMDAAINYFKQQGINIDQAKLMESIRHNQSTETITANHNAATEANANNALKLRTYEAFGYGPDGKTPTLSRETLNNTIAHDQALIQDAQSAQKDTQNKTSIDALGKELTSINSQINAIYNNPPSTNDPNFKDQSARNVQSIKDLGVRRDNLVTDLSKFAQSANVATQPQNGTNPTN